MTQCQGKDSKGMNRNDSVTQDSMTQDSMTQCTEGIQGLKAQREGFKGNE